MDSKDQKDDVEDIQPSLRGSEFKRVQDRYMEMDREEWQESLAKQYDPLRTKKTEPFVLEGMEADERTKEFFSKAVEAEVDEDMIERVKSAGTIKELPDLKVPEEVEETVGPFPAYTYVDGDGKETTLGAMPQRTYKRRIFAHSDDCDCSYCQPEAPCEGSPPDTDWWEHPFADAELLKNMNGVTYKKKGGEWIVDVPVFRLYSPEEQRAIHDRLLELRPGIRKFVENPDMDECSTYDIFRMWDEHLNHVAKEMEKNFGRPKPSGKPLKGILMVYINVGQMAPDTAEDHITKFRQEYDDMFSRLPDDIEPVFFQVRGSQETRMELLHF